MTKVLKCGDVVPRCKEEIKGDSEHDVLRKAAEHAKTAHHMDSIPPDVLSKVKGAVHDGDDAQFIAAARECGPTGYVEKQYAGTELANAIDATASGKQFFLH
jgi:predicted small metal-binding protein